MKIVVNTIIAISIAVLMMPVVVFAQAPKPVTQLTSNSIMSLAGSVDTLWLATERGFNYRVSDKQDGWPGFEIGDLAYRFWDMAFGGGNLAAVVYNGNETSSDYIGFWHFDHRTGQPRERYFRFSTDLRDDNDEYPVPVGGMIYVGGKFFVPFGRGGMVRYDPSANTIRAIRPGDADESDPSSIGADGTPDENERAERVVSSLANYGDGKILVTAPRALWVYDPAGVDANGKWTKIYDAQTLAFGTSSSNGEFESFVAAFTMDKEDAGSTLYCVMNMKRGAARYTSLHSFSTNDDKWYRALKDESNLDIFPIRGGALFTLSDNRVKLFADTLSAGGGRDNHLKEILTHEKFREMLDKAGGEPNPIVKDILFLPVADNDGSGRLVVATESGLYICGASPLAGEYFPFQFVNHVRSVKRGEAYALPGIMRVSDGRYDKSVFVYGLKKDGKVTIRVYDYNMSLVKTVVKGARRVKGERSNDPSQDFWDGTNGRGKRAYPGVYYFKITSSGGERFFGKVVLAK